MPHILFVTGKLAEPSLRRLLAELAPRAGFDYSVAVLPISVAALTTTAWVAGHLDVPSGIDRMVIPGLCSGALAPLQEKTGLSVERGPKDLRDLPEFFGAGSKTSADYGKFDISILAEINDAPRLGLDQLRAQAKRLRDDGADIIDLGCSPGETWVDLGHTVRSLRDEGCRVSVDTFNLREAEAGAKAGAELILSVNKTNRDAAKSWGCPVVAVPDSTGTLDGLDDTVQALEAAGVRYRIDPVLEPIGFGFARSLGRYLEVRRRYPQAEMLMGVGNLTELTDVDSAGVNVLLLGFCQEIGIRSVLTTEVINWCRSSVRELDRARRLVFHASTNHVLPKHLEPDLVLLRDPKIREHGEETLRELAAAVTDRNFRIFAERGLLHVMNGDLYLQGTDPFVLFDSILAKAAVDPAHAFYVGYEMAKAVTALTLGKNYVQDQALRWGFLTVEEEGQRGKKRTT